MMKLWLIAKKTSSASLVRCERNPLVTGGFPSRRASNLDRVSISSRYNGDIGQQYGPLTRYVKLRVAHASGMPGTFSPPPHVTWCMSGSLTRDGVSNHQPHHCLLNRLFGRRSKKTSKLRVTGLCMGNSPGTGEFPAQMASNAENVSIWWRHYAGESVPEWLEKKWFITVVYKLWSISYRINSSVLSLRHNQWQETEKDDIHNITPQWDMDKPIKTEQSKKNKLNKMAIGDCLMIRTIVCWYFRAQNDSP